MTIPQIEYSKLESEAQLYLHWSKTNPIIKVPLSVAREGAGSEYRTPLMHCGTVSPVYFAIIRYLKKINLKKDSRLLDIGCGTGRFLGFIKTVFPNIATVGQDGSEEVIAYARYNYKSNGLSFTTKNLKEIKSSSFDIIISSHVLEHIPRKEGVNFLRELNRILKKGGFCFIGTPERRMCQNVYDPNPSDLVSKRLITPHEHEYTQDELKMLASEVFNPSRTKLNLLYNPKFRSIFIENINKIKPDKKLANLIFNLLRKNLPLDFHENIQRTLIYLNIKLKKLTFDQIIKDNSIHGETDTIADNLLLICQK